MVTTQRFNIPTIHQLTPDEERYVGPGRDAMATLQKTFDTWIVVIRAWKTLRAKADRLGGRDTFARLMDQNGFRMNPRPPEDKVIDKSVVTKGLNILDRLAEVGPWHERLTPKQRREWASPSAIYKHCPIFQKPKPEGESEGESGDDTSPTPMQRLAKLRKDYLAQTKMLTTAERAEELATIIKALGGKAAKAPSPRAAIITGGDAEQPQQPKAKAKAKAKGKRGKSDPHAGFLPAIRAHFESLNEEQREQQINDAVGSKGTRNINKLVSGQHGRRKKAKVKGKRANASKDAKADDDAGAPLEWKDARIRGLEFFGVHNRVFEAPLSSNTSYLVNDNNSSGRRWAATYSEAAPAGQWPRRKNIEIIADVSLAKAKAACQAHYAAATKRTAAKRGKAKADDELVWTDEYHPNFNYLDRSTAPASPPACYELSRQTRFTGLLGGRQQAKEIIGVYYHPDGMATVTGRTNRVLLANVGVTKKDIKKAKAIAQAHHAAGQDR
jgi:hypothetical protein